MLALKARRIVGLIFLIFSLVILAWGVWPHRSGLRSLAFSLDSDLAKPEAKIAMPAFSNLATLIEESRFEVEIPSRVRLGDSAVFRIGLNLENSGGLAADLIETHNILAQARFEIGGVQITPAGEISEPLRPGKKAAVFWSVRPTQVGEYRGVIWLHLRVIPISGGQERIIPLTAQFTKFQALTFLGMGGPAARIAGGIGVVLGALMIFADVFSRLWQFWEDRVNLS